MPTATAFPVEPEGWARGTKHYSTSDGRTLAVIFDEYSTSPDVLQYVNRALEEELGVPAVEVAPHVILLAPTVIVECHPDGTAIDLTPVSESPPGTDYAEALGVYGYTVTA